MKGECALKNKVSRAIKILVSIILVFLIGGVLNFVLSPVTYGHWAEHYHDEYSGKIDTVILGDSFPMYAVQPSLLDEKFGCFSFNESTASQSLKESYYILLDYIQTEKIKTVYFGLDYYNFLTNEISIQAAQISFKRLNSPKVRLLFLKEFMTLDNACDWIFPVRLSKNNFLEIPQNINKKLTYEYRNYLPIKSDSYYYDKGYVYTDKIKGDELGSFDMIKMLDEQIQWFEKIVRLCKDNNIALNVFQTPNKQARIDVIENYDLYYQTIDSLSDKYEFRYYDFNYHINRETLSDEVHFFDAGHLNYSGSLVFMAWFCETFSEDEKTAERFFDYKFN